MRFLFSFLSLVATLCLCQVPNFPISYHMKGIMELPYAHISQPIESWFDPQNGHQRVEYYNGVDTFIYRSDLSQTWQINPVVDSQMCFLMSGEVSLTSFFPDVSTFTLSPNTVMIDGHTCYDYQLEVTVGTKKNTYDLFFDTTTLLPVQYNMYGYDSLLGSHYDLYILKYSMIEEMTFSPSDPLFSHPSLNCGDFPSPSLSLYDPSVEVTMHMAPSSLSPSLSPSSELSKEFVEFMQSYSKSYKNEEELVKRHHLFNHNLKYVNHHNYFNQLRNKSMRLAINHLADLDETTMNRYRGISSVKSTIVANDALPHSLSPSPKEYPTNFDWNGKGPVGPVADQGICGSCWSFATAAVIEGQYYMQSGKFEKISEQELVDCSWYQGSYGCDGGNDYLAYRWVSLNGGISATKDYGEYTMSDQYCRANVTNPILTIKSYVNVTSRSHDATMDALTNVGPLSISIDASHKSLSFYSSGVYDEPLCKQGVDDLDHAVLLTGYGVDATTGESYWVVKNSWSTNWGNQGYVYISQNQDCGVTTFPTYPNIVVLN